MTKPTPAQIQRACDLATHHTMEHCWSLRDYGVEWTITALADTIAQLDAMQIRAELAEAHKAEAETHITELRADLREIDRLLKSYIDGAAMKPISWITNAAALAAPYRVETDPLVEALRCWENFVIGDATKFAASLRAELAKRGIEV